MRISRELVERIVAEAAAQPDREICGLLLGDGAGISEAIAAANVAEDASRAFEVDPVTLFAALKAERAGGPKVIGHYHSHPNGLAIPSARDAAVAEPGWYWMIVGGGEAALWWAETPGIFRPVRLAVA